MTFSTSSVSRREFLKRSGLLAAAGFTTPLAGELALLSNTATAQSSPDYRALVCVFLLGGNDSTATFVPSDAESYQRCLEMRGHLMPDRRSLLDLGGDGTTGRELGFAPQLSGVKSIFDRGDLAVVANVGPLLGPTTKKAYADIRNRPTQLFSHNDQQSTWQSSGPEGNTIGWGGRLGDLLMDSNGSNTAFTCMSTAGHAVMMSGQYASQYQINPKGVTKLFSPFQSGSVLEGLEEVMMLDDPSLFGSAYQTVNESSLRTSDTLSQAVEPTPIGLPATRVGAQLDMVARLIDAGRGPLGLKRQVFFVGMGGFDTHASHATDHPRLLLELDQSLKQFDDAIRRMGLADSVTTFTASEFGRTVSANSTGTDHGWGGHHMVMGGAVAGGKIVGTLPVIDDDGVDDVGRGRLLPKLSTDQYAGALATWMGVEDAQLTTVVPSLSRFDRIDGALFGAGTVHSGGPGGTTGGGTTGGSGGGTGQGKEGLIGGSISNSGGLESARRRQYSRIGK